MNRSLLDQLVWMIALFFSGVAAGMFLLDFFSYYPVLPRLPAQAAIEFHQQSLAARRIIFQLAIGGSGLASILLLIFFSDGASRRLLVVHLLYLIALIIYTNWAIIPLNREIATWRPASPPLDWQHSFSKMIVLERLRSFLPTFAFVVELIALAARRARFSVGRGDG